MHWNNIAVKLVKIEYELQNKKRQIKTEQNTQTQPVTFQQIAQSSKSTLQNISKDPTVSIPTLPKIELQYLEKPAISGDVLSQTEPFPLVEPSKNEEPSGGNFIFPTLALLGVGCLAYWIYRREQNITESDLIEEGSIPETFERIQPFRDEFKFSLRAAIGVGTLLLIKRILKI